MKLSLTELSSVVSNQTYKKGITKSIGRDIAKILVSTKKTSTLNSLIRNVQYDWSEFGYVDVVARSAFQLDIATKAEIKKIVVRNYPKAKHIKIIEEIDPTVLAGVFLELPNKQLDLSILSKINVLKNFTVLNKKG